MQQLKNGIDRRDGEITCLTAELDRVRKALEEAEVRMKLLCLCLCVSFLNVYVLSGWAE